MTQGETTATICIIWVCLSHHPPAAKKSSTSQALSKRIVVDITFSTRKLKRFVKGLFLSFNLSASVSLHMIISKTTLCFGDEFFVFFDFPIPQTFCKLMICFFLPLLAISILVCPLSHINLHFVSLSCLFCFFDE